MPTPVGINMGGHSAVPMGVYCDQKSGSRRSPTTPCNAALADIRTCDAALFPPAAAALLGMFYCLDT